MEVVLRGRPTLRTPEGEQELVEGDVVCFRRGPAGLHQVRNETEEPALMLMLSTRIAPEILEYPDSGKVVTEDAKGEDIFMTRHESQSATGTASRRLRRLTAAGREARRGTSPALAAPAG